MSLLQRQSMPVRRLAATMVDVLLLVLPVIVAYRLTVAQHPQLFSHPHVLSPDEVRAVQALLGTAMLAVFCWPVYQTLMLWRRGATIGKLLAGVRVVRVDDPSRRLGLLAGASREFVRSFSLSACALMGPAGLALGVVILLAPALIRADRRVLYDLVAGTQVVDAAEARRFASTATSSAKATRR